MEGRGGGKNDDERGAGYAGGAFAADEQGEEHDRLLGRGEVEACGLRDEDEREGLVQARAIEIEAVAGGENESDGYAGNAERFHFFHGAGESRFGAGGGEGDGDGLGSGTEELFYRHACEKRDGQQDAGYEND